MAERRATIQNINGIHCRPSAVIIKEVHAFPGHTAHVQCGDRACDPCSILGLMSMGLAKGEVVTIEVEGPDAETFADHLVDLLSRCYDFPNAETTD